MPLKIGLWNTQWKRSSTPAGRLMADKLLSTDPEVVCVTEGYQDQLPVDWFVCGSNADHGYRPIVDGRRKVLLFSRSPWRDVDPLGDPQLPPGRFVAATTETSVGSLRFIGVCVPWKDAHVRTGNRNRQPWEDHKTYLSGLRDILGQSKTRTVLLGDFNQRIPRRMQPEDVSDQLAKTLGQNFNVLTAGLIPGVNDYAIDHVACTSDLKLKSLMGLPNVISGVTVSDHFGMVLELEAL